MKNILKELITLVLVAKRNKLYKKWHDIKCMKNVAKPITLVPWRRSENLKTNNLQTGDGVGPCYKFYPESFAFTRDTMSGVYSNFIWFLTTTLISF